MTDMTEEEARATVVPYWWESALQGRKVDGRR
jgi:hypothetical protein